MLMEFYNITNHDYLNLINRPIKHCKIRLELLDHNENTIDSIEKDLDSDNSGSISCSYEQGLRKSCSISLTNIDEKYTPNENNPFWFNRKFRLYIGVVGERKECNRFDEYETYWFAKGVFIAQDVRCDSVNHTVSISGVDKFAQLDGTLNVLQADEMNTVFEIGSSVKKVVIDTLMLNMGNGLPLDPIEPIIDSEIEEQTLYKEFTLSAGQYYGDFLKELATSFGCEIFYDNIGRLTLRRAFTDDVAYWNAFKAPSHEFEYGYQGYIDPQESVSLNGVNKIIVKTENVETPNASYTAINHNPRSPMCYDKIGARTLPENGGVITINAGNLYQDNRTAEYMVMKRCKDYAEYRLMKETCVAIQISFNCTMFPHINEGDIISITDKQFNLDHDTFIVNSITFDMNDFTMQMQVANTQYLNTDIDLSPDIITHDVPNMEVIIEYKITGGTAITPTPMVLSPGTQTFVTASGYDNENKFDTFYKNDNYEAIAWINQYNGETYPIGFETYNPYFDSVLFPYWENIEDRSLMIVIHDCDEGTWNMSKVNVTTNSKVLESVKVGTNKYYFYGRGQVNNYITIPTNGNMTIHHVLLEYPDPVSYEYGYNQIISQISSLIGRCSSSVNNGVGYSVKLPDVLTSYFAFINTYNLSGLNYTSFTFGNQVEIIGIKSFLSGSYNLETLDFNNQNELTLYYNAQSSGETMLGSCSKLSHIYAVNTVSIMRNRSLGQNKLSIGAGASLPEISFPNGLVLEYVQFFLGCGTDKARTLLFGDNSLNDKSVLSVSDSEILHGINAPNCDIVINRLTINQSTFFTGATIKSLTIAGDLVSHSDKTSVTSFLVGSTIQSENLTVGGDTVIAYGGTYFISISVLQTIEFIGSVLFNFNSLYNHSLTFIANNRQLTTALFHGRVNLTETSLPSDNPISFIVGNDTLTEIRFFDKVNLNAGTNQNTSVICGNPLLTDIYFYNEELILPSAVTALASNNEDFKIHGIANSSVQTIAESRGIPFVAITEEELAEAGL